MRYASKIMKSASIVLVLFALWLTPQAAWSVENLTINVPQVRVYGTASPSGDVITTLRKGQVVQAGSNPAGGYKKVLVTDRTGKKRIGYISIVDLTRAPVAMNASKKNSSTSKSAIHPTGHGLHNAYAFAINLGVDYIMQSSRTVTDSSGNSGTVASPSGANLEFGASFYIPVKPRFSIVLDLNYKPTSFTGNFAYSGSAAPITSVLAQSFVSLGGYLKFYSGASDNYWYGVGLQDDHGLSSTFQLGTNTTTANTNDFIFMYATTGYDFQASQGFYIIPSLRLGALVNASPISIEFDAMVSGAFRF